MGIVRYENVTINNVTNGTSQYGEQTTTITPWFTSRAKVKDVHNSLRISERYRVYSDLADFTFNYTPNIKLIVDYQPLYSFNWRGFDWRITDVYESDDRMSISFVCYRNDPSAPV